MFKFDLPQVSRDFKTLTLTGLLQAFFLKQVLVLSDSYPANLPRLAEPARSRAVAGITLGWSGYANDVDITRETLQETTEINLQISLITSRKIGAKDKLWEN